MSKKTYDNTNSGAVWTNSNPKSDKAPAYTGTLDVEGREYEVAVWEVKSDNPRAPRFNFRIKDKVAAEVEAHERRMAYLRNKSEAEA